MLELSNRQQFETQLINLGLDDGRKVWTAIGKPRPDIQQVIQWDGSKWLLQETGWLSGKRHIKHKTYDAFDYFTSKAWEGYNIYHYPALVDGGIKAENFVNQGVLSSEIDPVTEDYDLVEEFKKQDAAIKHLRETSGLDPAAITNSQGKSKHIQFKFKIPCGKETAYRLHCKLGVLLSADPAVTNTVRCFRLAGFPRNGKFTTLEFTSEASYTAEEIEKGLDRTWNTLFQYPFTEEGYKKWKSEATRQPKNTRRFDYFNREPETIDVQSYSSRSVNFYGSNSIIAEYHRDSLNLPVERIYSLFDHDFTDYRDKAVGNSPFSATNSSGTSFKVFKDNYVWHCHATNESGNIYRYICEQLLGKATASGKEFIEVIRKWAEILGRDADADLKTFKPKPQLSGKITKTEAEAFFAPIEETIDKPVKLGSTVVYTSNSKLKDKLSEQLQLPVLGSMNVASLIAKTTSEVLEAHLIVEPGDLQSNRALAWLDIMFAKLEAAGVSKVFVLWHNQFTSQSKTLFEVDPKKVKLYDFEKFSKTVYAVTQKIKRLETLVRIEKPSIEPVMTGDWQYLNGNIPEAVASELIIISSAMGTGKTYFVQKMLEADPTAFAFVGYRNALLRQISAKVGATMKIDNKEYSQYLNYALCTDSLMTLPESYWYGRTLILDEIEAVIAHTILGTTIKSNRSPIVARLKDIINICLTTGGKVIAMEANVTDITIRFFRDLCGVEPTYIRNDYCPKDWNPTVATGSTSEQQKLILEAIANGEKVVIPTDSKEQADEIHKMILRQNKKTKVLTLTRDTAETNVVKTFLDNPNDYLESENPDVLIYTPTFESGGDITVEYFDSMYSIFTCLSTRAHLQLLGRVRAPLKRFVYVKECIENTHDETIYDPDLNYERKAENFLTGVDRYLGDSILLEKGSALDQIQQFTSGVGLSVEMLKLVCAIECRDNIYKNSSYESLVRELSKNHTVTLAHYNIDAETKAIATEIADEIKQEKAVAFFEADISDWTKAKADQIMKKSTASKEDALKAHKFMQLHVLPGLLLSLEMSYDLFVGNAPKIRAIKKHWLMKNPKIAKAQEYKELEFLLSQDNISVADYKATGQQADLFDKLGVFSILDTKEWNAASLQDFSNKAKRYSTELNRLFGLKAGAAPVKLFHTLLSRIGLETRQLSQVKGERSYTLSENPYSEVIFNALDQHYEVNTKLEQGILKLENAETLTAQAKSITAKAYINTVNASAVTTSSDYWQDLAPDERKDERSAKVLNEMPVEKLFRISNLNMEMLHSLENKASLKVLSLKYSKAERQLAYDALDIPTRKLVRELLS
jgi:hypothetical protein